MSANRVDLAELVASDFEPLIDDEFRAAVDEGKEPTSSLKLVAVEVLRGQRQSGSCPFSLRFRSDGDLPVRQQVFWVTHRQLGTLPIFMVPLKATEDSAVFQAVFN